MLSGVMYVNVSINFLKTYPKEETLHKHQQYHEKKVGWNNNINGDFNSQEIAALRSQHEILNLRIRNDSVIIA